MPGIEFTLDLIKSGAIGKVVSVQADFAFKAPFLPENRLFNKELGGGSPARYWHLSAVLVVPDFGKTGQPESVGDVWHNRR